MVLSPKRCTFRGRVESELDSVSDRDKEWRENGRGEEARDGVGVVDDKEARDGVGVVDDEESEDDLSGITSGYPVSMKG